MNGVIVIDADEALGLTVCTSLDDQHAEAAVNAWHPPSEDANGWRLAGDAPVGAECPHVSGRRHLLFVC